MLAALAFVQGEVGDASASRVAILHNPTAAAAGPPSQLQRIVLAATAVPSRRPKLPGECPPKSLDHSTSTPWGPWCMSPLDLGCRRRAKTGLCCFLCYSRSPSFESLYPDRLPGGSAET